MKIQSINQNNNTNFGIRYLNKNSWNKKLLETLENSNLVKDIDRKYPDAYAKYAKFNLTDMDLGNDEPNYLSSLIIYLTKNRIFSFNINSHTSEGADKALNSYVKDAALEYIENNAKNKPEMPQFSVEIESLKRQNIFSRILSKILG